MLKGFTNASITEKYLMRNVRNDFFEKKTFLFLQILFQKYMIFLKFSQSRFPLRNKETRKVCFEKN